MIGHLLVNRLDRGSFHNDDTVANCHKTVTFRAVGTYSPYK